MDSPIRLGLGRIARVRIRRTLRVRTRAGAGSRPWTRVTQTSAGFSDAGGLPACERMNRRRTGVATHCEHLEECAVYVCVSDAENKVFRSVFFLYYLRRMYTYIQWALVEMTPNLRNGTFIFSLFCSISGMRNSTMKGNVYL